MKVLITGATGFLGARLCFFLKKHGYTIFATGRNIDKGKKLNVPFTSIDLVEDSSILKELIKQVDIIVHCAALSSPFGKYEYFYKANVLATKNVCKNCLELGKKLIHISSSGVYFNYKDRLKINESDPLPRKKANYYAQTKYLAELEIDKYFSKGLKVITLRPRAIFGAGDTALIPRILKANNTKFIPIMHTPPLLADLTHVDNVCHAIELAINNKNYGKKYNVTNDESVELISFLKDVIERLGFTFKSRKIPYSFALIYGALLEFIHKYFLKNKEPVFTMYTIGLIAKSQTLNIENIKNELGYKPIVTMDEGVSEVVNWWKNENT